jgi:predicted TIM-barrel fold metal-dependent hydrolase
VSNKQEADQVDIVDAWANMPVPADKKLIPDVGDDPLLSNVGRWFHRQGGQMDSGASLVDFVKMMDDAGISKTLIAARHGWDHPDFKPRGVFETTHGISDEIFDQFCQEQADMVKAYPDRLFGTAHIDPLGGLQAFRQLERAVKDFGCVAARLMPAMPGIPIDDPRCYPIYARCADLGVPITINLGVPGPMRAARLQRPMLLDEILLAFPELIVVGTHIGHPWHLETVALLQKHPNFFLMTSGWAPKYVPKEILDFMNSRGANRVMFASDFPLLSMERTVQEALKLPLKENVLERYMGANCVEVFKLG